MCFFGCSTAEATEADLAQTLSTSGTLSFHHDRLHTLARRVLGEVLCEAVPKVPNVCPEGFWHFWHPVG